MTVTFPPFPLHFICPARKVWHDKEIAQYERAAIALKYVTNGDVAVDVGAFGGAWSYAFSQLFRTVHAFEPHERNYAIARLNLAEQRNVTVYRLGLMDTPGSGAMTPGGGKYDYVARGEGQVVITTLDSFSIAGCDLLKIDTEGADPLVLQGAERTIAKYHPVIIVEEKDTDGERYGLAPGAVNTLLTGWGYERVWAHDPDGIYVKRKRPLAGF